MKTHKEDCNYTKNQQRTIQNADVVVTEERIEPAPDEFLYRLFYFSKHMTATTTALKKTSPICCSCEEKNEKKEGYLSLSSSSFAVTFLSAFLALWKDPTALEGERDDQDALHREIPQEYVAQVEEYLHRLVTSATTTPPSPPSLLKPWLDYSFIVCAVNKHQNTYRPLGLVLLEELRETEEQHLHLIWLHKNLRGRGFGMEIMVMLQAATENGKKYNGIRLISYNVRIPFYKRLGFVIVKPGNSILADRREDETEMVWYKREIDCSSFF